MLNKFLKKAFGITVEKGKLKHWRGHKVPLRIYVRKHEPNCSFIWFTIIGPKDIKKWCQEHAERID